MVEDIRSIDERFKAACEKIARIRGYLFREMARFGLERPREYKLLWEGADQLLSLRDEILEERKRYSSNGLYN